MNKNIQNYWEEIEKSSISQNIVRKEIFVKDGLKLFLIKVKSEDKFVLRLSYPSLDFTIDDIKFKGIEFVNFTHKESNFSNTDLILKDNSLLRIFNAFIEDVFLNFGEYETHLQLVKVFWKTVNTWKKLFANISSFKLSPEIQLGLYGELCFINKLLELNKNPESIINSWCGPENESQDFNFNTSLVEVKSTRLNNPVIKISSENQLNNSSELPLYILLNAFDVIKSRENTLPNLINRIRTTLSDFPVVIEVFNRKLINLNYYEEDVIEYENRSYILRDETYYLVSDNFPKIVYDDLKVGLFNVSYSIETSACIDYIVLSEEVINRI
ncbi:PD-(D/E)XK motif protein [uncultured Algibacter sp.]|uniref:PD-(D/E)XK motif protein n=1 Tax=uncultured Algibacter sp. TaxID=298659 RepID=UPI0030EE3D0A